MVDRLVAGAGLIVFNLVTTAAYNVLFKITADTFGVNNAAFLNLASDILQNSLATLAALAVLWWERRSQFSVTESALGSADTDEEDVTSPLLAVAAQEDSGWERAL